MRRVLDLDGDVFAMPPRAPKWADTPDPMPPLGPLSDPLPDVGDVIANTRTPDDPTVEYLTEGTPVWADPPFLRVAEVEQSDDGGWAIRVEPATANADRGELMKLVLMVADLVMSGPPPTGRPLNEEAA